MIPLAAPQSCQAPFEILVQIALDGTPGDARVEGDLAVWYTQALQPEHFHLLLDTGVGVVIPVAGRCPSVIRREGNRAHDVTLHAASRDRSSSAFYACVSRPTIRAKPSRAEYNRCVTESSAPKMLYRLRPEAARTNSRT